LAGYFLWSSSTFVQESIHAARSPGFEEVCYFGYQVQDQAVGWVAGEHTDGGSATFGDVAFLGGLVWGLSWTLLFMVVFAFPTISRLTRKHQD